MKGILGLLKPRPGAPRVEAQDSGHFSQALGGRDQADDTVVSWDLRAGEIDAQPLLPPRGAKVLQALWAHDKMLAALDPQAVARMERFFRFATVPPRRDIIRQDEYGNYMVALLSGTVAVDRVQPWGEHLRLSEANPGDVLGEMSLLDRGIRFSSCSTITECRVAVLTAESLDAMMTSDAQLAARLVAMLARRLSVRLRMVSTRLSETRDEPSRRAPAT